MQPLIQIQKSDVALEGRTILRGIDWQLWPGEHWAVLGGNGSGKSTLLKLIRGDVWPAPGRGRRVYAFDGEPQTTAVGVRKKIALVSPELQQRYGQQEWRLTGRDVIHTGFFNTDFLYQRLDARRKARALSLAERLGIAALLRRDMQELSTGELRRILIARALVGSPRVLICDEICDGLDAAARTHLLETLQRVAEQGTQLLYTTHRREELIPAITHALWMEGGRIVRADRLGQASRLPLPKTPAPAAVPGKGRRDARPTPRGFDAPGESRSGSILIHIENADVYLGRKKILHRISWTLRRGEHWAVTGPNGAGKTTFLKLVASELHPAVGARVERFGLTARDTIWDLRRRIGRVSPELQANYHEPITGAEVIASGFFSSVGLRERPSRSQWRRVRALLKAFHAEPLAEQSARRMSYGEFRKLLLLRALAPEPEALIFDEPFDGLDAASKAGMAGALERAAVAGTSLIVVTHHAADLPACITHELGLERGRIVSQRRRETTSE